jgi:hypothetical protein
MTRLAERPLISQGSGIIVSVQYVLALHLNSCIPSCYATTRHCSEDTLGKKRQRFPVPYQIQLPLLQCAWSNSPVNKLC